MAELHLSWEHDLHQRASSLAVVTPSMIVVPERHTKLARLDVDGDGPVWVADVRNPWGLGRGR